MKRNLYNMEFGTFITTADGLMLSLPKQLFDIPSLEALKQIVGILNEQPEFFEISDVTEDSQSYTINYALDFAHFRNLKSIQKEPPATRLSIAKRIMEQDILSRYDGYVSAAPANLWYHPMRTVKYTYRGNFNMPYTENEPNLVRYKALLLYILIGYSYERALRKEYKISEKKNPFAVQIINAESVSKLAQLIAEQEDFVLARNMVMQKKNTRSLAVLAVTAAIALLLSNVGTFFATSNYIAAAADSAVQEQLEVTQSELKELQTNLALDTALSANDFEGAAAVMTEAGFTSEEIAALMFEHDQLNLALQHSPDILEQILQALYNASETERIFALILPSGSDAELQEKLSMEQAVVSYNTQTLGASWPFIQDKHTLTRAAAAYVNNNNTYPAEQIAARLDSNGHTAEAAYVTALVANNQAAAALEAANAELDRASALPETDENRENQITVANNDIAAYTDALKSAEDNVLSAKEALDDAWSASKKEDS